MRKLLRLCEVTRPKYTDDIEEWIVDDLDPLMAALDAHDFVAFEKRYHEVGRLRERAAPALAEGVDRLEAPGHATAGSGSHTTRLATTSDRDRMMASLIEHGIRSPAVLHAMAGVPREEFVLEEDRERAYADRALPIDAPGQTISQPLMVAVVVEALELHAGDRALDVGTGSGYQAAVMAACGAHVVSIERVSSLAQTAAERLRRLRLRRGGRRGRRHAGGPGTGAVRRHRRGGGRTAPAGGARPAARRGRAPGGADHRRRRRRAAHPAAAGRRALGDRVTRSVPLRAADRRRRLSGAPSRADRSPRRRVPAGTRNIRIRDEPPDRSTALRRRHRRTPTSSTIPTSSLPGGRSSSGRDSVTAY